jgi:hypothetical protein
MNNWNFLKTINIRQNIKQKQITKQTWNERHGKQNWNKDNFKVHLGHHLKEVVILQYPRCRNKRTIQKM